MAQRVLFNGVVLIRPGAATRIDASQFEDVNLDGIGVVGLIGSADGGEPRTIQSFRTASSVKNFYRGGDLVEAASIAASPGNDTIITAGAQLIICYKVNNSTRSSLSKPPFVFESVDYGLHTNDIQMSCSSPDADDGRVVSLNTLDANGVQITETSPKLGMLGKMTVQYLGTSGVMSVQTTATQMIFTAGASAGQVLSGPQTFSLVPGDTLVVSVDALGDQVFTFAGTSGSVTSNNQTYNLTPTPPKNLVVSIDGEADQTFTFNGTHGALISAGGTYALTSGQHVDVKIDGGATTVVTFVGTAGKYVSGNDTYNLTPPGKTLVASINGGTDQTFTFSGTQGFKLGASATYAALNGKTLDIAHDGGADETVTFTMAAIDAATACTEINAQTTGLVATPSGLEILLTSDTYGTGSTIEVKNTSTALAETGFTAGLGTAGTGDAVNLAATTKTEVVAKLSTLVGGAATVVANHFEVTSNRIGTSSTVQIKASSTATALVADNLLHSGTGDASDFSAVTPAEVVTKIGGLLVGATVDNFSNAVRITSDSYGTGSSVQVMNTTTASNLGFDITGPHAGTGDAVNLAAVTAAEVQAKVTGSLTDATITTVAGPAVRIQSTRIGTLSSVQIKASSTAMIFPDNVVHSGTGDASDFAAVTAAEIVTKLAGLAGATATLNSGNKVLVKSATTGVASKVHMKPASTAAAAIGFDTIAHFGVNANASDNMTLDFAQYPTLDKIVRKLNSMPGVFVATALITGDTTWDTTYFDGQTITDIKAASGSLFARNWDILDWMSANSSIAFVSTLTKGQAAPITPFLNTTFNGGSRGVSSNSDWATGLTRLGSMRINQLVPLCSSDGVNGDTYTFEAVSSGVFEHAKYFSSTVGRSERQAWIGMRGTKAALISKANLFNSADVCLFGQRIKRFSAADGNVGMFFPEWATATAAAGMRAGAPLGEPLTHKYLLAYGVESDPSWSIRDKTDVEDLILNGVMMVDDVLGKGFRIEKGITTYTRTNNDAYVAEEVVQGWKNIAYDLRSSLEDKYIGRPNNLTIVQTVPSFVIEKMTGYETEGLITPSVVAGVRTPSYRNIVVGMNGDVIDLSVTFSPVQGINFILNTLVIVPARFSATA